jgi:hypothetical protein
MVLTEEDDAATARQDAMLLGVEQNQDVTSLWATWQRFVIIAFDD